MWQVQYFRVLREVLRGLTFFLCGRCNIFDASVKFLRDPGPWSLVTPPPFCVAGAIFSMPVTLPTFGVGSQVTTSWPCPRTSATISMPPRCCPLTVYLLVGKPYVCPQCDFVTLKPFPHPSAHPKTPVPPSYTLNVHIKPFVCLQCDFATLKPFPHPVLTLKPQSPPSYTLKGGCTYKAICLSTM